MKQTSSLTRKLTEAQEAIAKSKHSTGEVILYRLYTEDKAELLPLVRRYFPKGATLTNAIGIWDSGSELAKVIDIVGTLADMQRIFDLAGDIRVTCKQTSVLVTWQHVSRFDVTEVSINDAFAAL